MKELAEQDFLGLCFVNLVDFDMLYGHRNDIDGYAAALTEFDAWLSDFLPLLGEEDALIVTADHGCDPGSEGTDHTREYVPLIVYGRQINPIDLGERACFADVAATVLEWLDATAVTEGKSFAREVEKKNHA